MHFNPTALADTETRVISWHGRLAREACTHAGQPYSADIIRAQRLLHWRAKIASLLLISIRVQIELRGVLRNTGEPPVPRFRVVSSAVGESCSRHNVDP